MLQGENIINRHILVAIVFILGILTGVGVTTAYFFFSSSEPNRGRAAVNLEMTLSTKTLDTSVCEQCGGGVMSPYAGVEFVYKKLNNKYSTVLSGKSCPGSLGMNQECKSGQEAISRLVNSMDYAVNFEFFNFIAEHLGEPVYLRLFFYYIFDDISPGSDFQFSLPGTNEYISREDSIKERFTKAKKNTRANLEFGNPERAFGVGIILEDPRKIVNGINEVLHHPAGPVEIRGFFKFEELGHEKGMHYYRGRVLSVDTERALLTEKQYSNAQLMLGQVEYIVTSPFIKSLKEKSSQTTK